MTTSHEQPVPEPDAFSFASPGVSREEFYGEARDAGAWPPPTEDFWEIVEWEEKERAQLWVPPSRETLGDTLGSVTEPNEREAWLESSQRSFREHGPF